MSPPRLWLWNVRTGELADDIPLPGASRRDDSPSQLTIGKKRILLISAGDLLIYDISR